MARTIRKSGMKEVPLSEIKDDLIDACMRKDEQIIG
jgi:hypothetical protein